MAKIIWRKKTSFELQELVRRLTDEKVSESTVYTWLSGEHEPPGYVTAGVIAELTLRMARRGSQEDLVHERHAAPH